MTSKKKESALAPVVILARAIEAHIPELAGAQVVMRTFDGEASTAYYLKQHARAWKRGELFIQVQCFTSGTIMITTGWRTMSWFHLKAPLFAHTTERCLEHVEDAWTEYLLRKMAE